MKTIRLYDVTLRELSATRNRHLSFREKLEAVRTLDKLKLDGIELPAIVDQKTDSLLNRTLSGMINTELIVSVGTTAESVRAAWESVKTARRPVLHVMLPLSTVQMEYMCHKKAPAMLKTIEELVSASRALCDVVEFSALDATRAEPEFLAEAIGTALRCGATRVTYCDLAGLMMPSEFSAFIDSQFEAVPQLADVQVNVQLSDNIRMATANAAQAAQGRVTGFKVTAGALGMINLEDYSSFLRSRGSELGLEAGVRQTELRRTVRQLDWMTGESHDDASLIRTAGDESGANICLSASDPIAEVTKVVNQLGYDLSEEDYQNVYEAFQRVAEKKSFVGTKELEAIIASSALQVPATYLIESYVINSGNVITATANIALKKNGKPLRGMSMGDGPIDASFLAIEQIIGHHYELDDFQIQAITEGREAMGSALVKLRSGGKLYSGTGISTDIIGASIRAYINALNKIVYEEG